VSKPNSNVVTRSTTFDALPQWLTIREASIYLNTSEWFVRKCVDRRDLPHRRIGSKVILIPKIALSPDFLSTSRVASAGAEPAEARA
jgi:excisionase family DNA binding protein